MGKTILGIEIPWQWVRPWMTEGAWILAGVSLFTAVFFEIRSLRAGVGLNKAKWLFTASVALGYWLLSRIPSLELATLGYLCWHAAQYAGLTYRINRRRAVQMKSESAFLSGISRPGHGGYYAAAIFFHGVLVYLAIAALPRLTPQVPNPAILWAVAVLYALSFSHFLLDVTLMAVPRYWLVQGRPDR